ncbi:unnamed protein product [Pedinophyceae sp. YPF-701]|nr:unnamed protein product [Pedinophyceae sp. YPF-701]
MSAGGPIAKVSEGQDLYPHGLACISGKKDVHAILNRLDGDFEIIDMEKSAFVKPQSCSFGQDGGRRRRWDMVVSHPSVAVLLYNRTRDALVLVRQFRPPVYASEMRDKGALPMSGGLTYELCAGIVDKDKSLAEIAKEEVLEECGYDVPLASIKPLTSFISAIGISGSRQAIFYAEVDDAQKVADGGGTDADGEAIEVLALPMANLEDFLIDDSLAKSGGLMFAAMWFKHRMGGKL